MECECGHPCTSSCHACRHEHTKYEERKKEKERNKRGRKGRETARKKAQTKRKKEVRAKSRNFTFHFVSVFALFFVLFSTFFLRHKTTAATKATINTHIITSHAATERGREICNFSCHPVIRNMGVMLTALRVAQVAHRELGQCRVKLWKQSTWVRERELTTNGFVAEATVRQPFNRRNYTETEDNKAKNNGRRWWRREQQPQQQRIRMKLIFLQKQRRKNKWKTFVEWNFVLEINSSS